MADLIALLDRAQLLLWAYHPAAARTLLRQAGDDLGERQDGRQGRGRPKGTVDRMREQIDELSQIARGLERMERALFPDDPWVLERTSDFACVVFRPEPYRLEARIAAISLQCGWPRSAEDLDISQVTGAAILEGEDPGAQEFMCSIQVGDARGIVHFDRHGFGEGEFLTLPTHAPDGEDVRISLSRILTTLASAIYLPAQDVAAR
jgi:hypothetical protein